MSPTFTTEEVLGRLEILRRKLEDEGSYVRANTVSLAMEEIASLGGVLFLLETAADPDRQHVAKYSIWTEAITLSSKARAQKIMAGHDAAIAALTRSTP